MTESATTGAQDLVIGFLQAGHVKAAIAVAILTPAWFVVPKILMEIRLWRVAMRELENEREHQAARNALERDVLMAQIGMNQRPALPVNSAGSGHVNPGAGMLGPTGEET